MSHEADTRTIETSSPAATSREPKPIEAGTLMGQAREVAILHKGERYRLRLTQNDKLILTK